MNNKIANRQSISDYFSTDELTTHRILSNLNWGFFVSHFKSDADKMWKQAHPFKYAKHDSIDYTSFDLDFIAKHFDLFARNQFYTSAGWKFNASINKMEWTYDSGYMTA